MPVVTKKHRTDVVELRFIGPIKKKNKAVHLLKDLGFEDTTDSIPWREAFPDHDESKEPGIFLAGARAKEGLTQKKLSEITGIPQRHISEMENGKRSIGKKNAMKLSKALNIGYMVFL